MTALQSFLLHIEEEYSHLYNMDSAYTLKEYEENGNSSMKRNDLAIVIKEYSLDDIPGISDWFKYISKDLNSSDGVPRPIDDTMRKVTGMSVDEAVKWLALNASDVGQIGSASTVLLFFRKNTKAYQICLVLGAAFGFYNKNPLLIATNALFYFNKLKQENRLRKGFWSATDRFLRTSYAMMDRVCAFVFITNTVLNFTGMSSPEIIRRTLINFSILKQIFKTSQNIVDAGKAAAGFIDVLGTFGLGFLLNKSLKKGFQLLNSGVREELEKIAPLADLKKRIYELIKNEAPPESLMPVVELLYDGGCYQPILMEEEKPEIPGKAG